MRKLWISLILVTTAVLYKRKKLILISHSVRSISNLLIIILLELFLALISIPIYLVSKEAISGDQRSYKIRRIISLSSLVIILIVWVFKLIFIIGIPIYYDTKQIYFVSDKQINAKYQQSDFPLLDFYGLVKNETMNQPYIKKVFFASDNKLYASGISAPNVNVVLYIYRPDGVNGYGVLYLGKSNGSGDWLLNFENNKWKKVYGLYSAQLVAYDDKSGSGRFSSAISFEIKKNWLEKFIPKIDMFLNYFILTVLVTGILSIILLM